MTEARIDLLAERLNRGLSLKDAAAAMEVAEGVLVGAENRGTRPHPSNAFKIASFYGHKVTDVWPLDKERPAA